MGPTTPSELYQLIGLSIDVLTLVALVTSVVLVYKQIRKEHEWNRRKTSHDMLMAFVTGDFARLREDLEVRFGVLLEDLNQDYTHVANTIPPEQKRAFDFAVEKLLNFYETICIGLKNSVLDEDACFDHFSWNLTRYWKWATPYHTSLRRVDPTIWQEAAHYVRKWSRRIEDDLAVLRREGKARL